MGFIGQESAFFLLFSSLAGVVEGGGGRLLSFIAFEGFTAIIRAGSS